MHYKVRNVTMEISLTKGEFAGSCICYIPGNHVEFFDSWCGFKKSDNNEDFTAYETDSGFVSGNEEEGFVTYDADILIIYLAWLFEQDGEQIIRVEYQNPFWAIHDAEHAQHDEAGCTITVDEHIELIRIRDAFEMMKKAGYEASWEIIEEVTKAYNERFDTNVSFEEYFEYEDFEDDDE